MTGKMDLSRAIEIIKEFMAKLQYGQIRIYIENGKIIYVTEQKTHK